jgi:beta-lactamase regulating signal transducer with metallopeptidase domain
MNWSDNLIGGIEAPTLLVWIVGILAAIFIFIVLYDSFRRSRRLGRKPARSGSSSKDAASFRGRLRLLSQALASESAKRRRRREIQARDEIK